MWGTDDLLALFRCLSCELQLPLADSGSDQKVRDSLLVICLLSGYYHAIRADECAVKFRKIQMIATEPASRAILRNPYASFSWPSALSV